MAYALASTTIATPIGPVLIECDGGVLTAIRIGSSGVESAHHPLLTEAAAQLHAYFAGRLRSFRLPLAAPATSRGPALRDAISSIGYGDTASYADIAEQTGATARAIGQACATNRFPIVVPCHRILPSGGRLGYYSAGAGPATKVWLLKHEGAEGWLL